MNFEASIAIIASTVRSTHMALMQSILTLLPLSLLRRLWWCFCGCTRSLIVLFKSYVGIRIAHSYACRPGTDRIPEGVSKKFLRNRNRDSCEKSARGKENTGILRIPIGITNLASNCTRWNHIARWYLHDPARHLRLLWNACLLMTSLLPYIIQELHHLRFARAILPMLWIPNIISLLRNCTAWRDVAAFKIIVTLLPLKMATSSITANSLSHLGLIPPFLRLPAANS